MADKRKRAAPTIDLTATEVPAETSESPAAPEAESPPPKSAAPPEPPQRDDAKAAPEPPPAAATDGAHMRRPSAGIYAAAVAAGLAGAALMTAVFAALWFAGLLPGRSVQSNDAPLAALQKQVQALQNRPASAPDTKAVDALRQSVRKLESDIAKLPQRDDAIMGARLTAIDNAMNALSVSLASLNKRSDDIAARAAQAEQQAAAAAKTVSALRDSVQTAGNASPGMDPAVLEALQKRVAALEQSVKSTREEIGKTSATDKAARLAFSAAALRDAVTSGAPYADALARAKALGADDSALAPLASFAASGLPGKAALMQELSALIPALMKTAGGEAASGSFLARLQANAGKIVRIQPIDAPSGDNPSDVLARIEVDAARDDIGGALADIGKLPEAARRQAAGWVTKAVARQKALAAAQAFASNAARALGGQ